MLRSGRAPAREHAAPGPRPAARRRRSRGARSRRASTRGAITCATTAARRCGALHRPISASSRSPCGAPPGRPARGGCCSRAPCGRAFDRGFFLRDRAQRLHVVVVGLDRFGLRGRRALRARSTRGRGRCPPAAPARRALGSRVQVEAAQREPRLRVRRLQPHGALRACARGVGSPAGLLGRWRARTALRPTADRARPRCAPARRGRGVARQQPERACARFFGALRLPLRPRRSAAPPAIPRAATRSAPAPGPERAPRPARGRGRSGARPRASGSSGAQQRPAPGQPAGAEQRRERGARHVPGPVDQRSACRTGRPCRACSACPIRSGP